MSRHPVASAAGRLRISDGTARVRPPRGARRSRNVPRGARRLHERSGRRRRRRGPRIAWRPLREGARRRARPRGTSRPRRMRAHRARPRCTRAQGRRRPRNRASRWPPRAGVTRGGHGRRGRRAREPDLERGAWARVAHRRDGVGSMQACDHHRAPSHEAPWGRRCSCSHMLPASRLPSRRARLGGSARPVPRASGVRRTLSRAARRPRVPPLPVRSRASGGTYRQPHG
jgi:hypothetical protein